MCRVGKDMKLENLIGPQRALLRIERERKRKGECVDSMGSECVLRKRERNMPIKE